MAKISDLFPGGSGVVPVLVTRISPSVETRYGKKSVVTVSSGGVDYDWFLDPARFSKLFAGVSTGDMIQVTGKPPAAGKTYGSYDVHKITDGQGTVIGSTPSTLPTPPQDPRRYEEIKQNRISIAGFAQALINSGKHDIANVKQLAIELVRWAKDQSEALYNEEQEKKERDALNLPTLDA